MSHVTWLIRHSHPKSQRLYSKSNRTLSQKYICITNWGKLVLQIGAALFYYKLGQTLLQIGAPSLLQNGASVVTNWEAITN